ncbi:hypothetical protein HNR73_006895 [Phytomonospora endophytica]|uniref:Uncharacterized protein n=1 Tax=Phytomonospora endophytica TaxID=714109 RepID=A0A841FSI7_9ACTN|nr:hypothetical protein [Phytomonospora endophytica]
MRPKGSGSLPTRDRLTGAGYNTAAAASSASARARLARVAHSDAGTRGRGDAGTRGRRDAGTPGRGDAGTRGRRDAGTPGRRDAGTPGRRDAGTRGRGDAGTRGREPTGERSKPRPRATRPPPRLRHRLALGSRASRTLRREDARTRGRGDAGTRGRGDAGTRGRGDAGTRGREDASQPASEASPVRELHGRRRVFGIGTRSARARAARSSSRCPGTSRLAIGSRAGRTLRGGGAGVRGCGGAGVRGCGGASPVREPHQISSRWRAGTPHPGPHRGPSPNAADSPTAPTGVANPPTAPTGAGEAGSGSRGRSLQQRGAWGGDGVSPQRRRSRHQTTPPTNNAANKQRRQQTMMRRGGPCPLVLPRRVPPEFVPRRSVGCPSLIDQLVGLTGTTITLTPGAELRLGALWELPGNFTHLQSAGDRYVPGLRPNVWTVVSILRVS